jgi:hypothetical protein
MAPVLLAIATGVLVSCWLSLGSTTSAVYAEVAPLSVAVDQSLSLVGQPVAVIISGQAGQSLNGTNLVVSVKGPVDAEQVGQADIEPSVVKKVTRWLGTPATATGVAAPTTPTVVPPGWSSAAELKAGALKAVMEITMGTPTQPGAYLVVVEVQSGATILASGQVWVGKVAARQAPLDVSFVLPVSLGIHRDWTGTFFDRVLEKATTPGNSEAESLRRLLPLADRFPEWNFTLAVEPILLTQLRDMADGYIFSDSPGTQSDVGKNDLAAQNAAVTLSELADLATRGTVEIVASPYTGADLGLLAAQGWRDGLEQVQMGKQELQSTLGLGAPLSGAYAPDLDLTNESLSYYAEASIDQVVVGTALQDSLAEEVEPGTVAVRAANTDNDRVTLVFADSAISAVMAAPWDVSAFSAAVAAALAAGNRDALVIAPGDLFGLMPASYVESIGEILSSKSWIQTQTMQEMVRLHSSGSRPLLLDAAFAQPAGYIERSLLAGVKSAHGPVSDLATAADTTRARVDLAHRLLYVAESRWWSREDTSPQEASMGLAYALQARAVAEGELDKVRLVRADSSLVTDGEGTVRVTVENAADYPMAVEVRLAGDGVTFPDGERLPMELQPGSTAISVRVASEGGPHRITVSLLAGASVLDELGHSVRFLGLRAALPWLLVVAGLLLAGGAYLFVYRRLRRRRQAAAE